MSLMLGLDPGREKMGWALVFNGGELLLSGIFPRGDLCLFLEIFTHPSSEWEERLNCRIRERQDVVPRGTEVECVALGNGTGSREAAECVMRFGLKMFLVDERGTTLAARDLYWKLHRPGLWRRCLPRSLWAPPGILDDMAAWAIALRGIEMGSAERKAVDSH